MKGAFFPISRHVCFLDIFLILSIFCIGFGLKLEQPNTEYESTVCTVFSLCGKMGTEKERKKKSLGDKI